MPSAESTHFSEEEAAPPTRFPPPHTEEHRENTNLRVLYLVLRASKTSAASTGGLTRNGACLDSKKIFNVNQDRNLVLPLKPFAGVLTLPSRSLGLSPKLIAQVATASPIAVVSPEPKLTAPAR